jgi:hypothetical protein
MASIGSFTFPSNGFEAVIFDCDGTLVDSMPAHFDAWCEALSLYGACGVFKEDVFFAMGGRPTRDIVVELNDEYNLHLDPEAVAFAKREAFLRRLNTVTLIDEVAAFAGEDVVGRRLATQTPAGDVRDRSPLNAPPRRGALAAGVKVVACENTMKGQKLARKDMIDGIGYVQAGVVELIVKQQQGYAYIRP